MNKDLEEIVRQLQIHNHLMVVLIAYIAPPEAVDAIDRLQVSMFNNIGNIEPLSHKD